MPLVFCYWLSWLCSWAGCFSGKSGSRDNGFSYSATLRSAFASYVSRFLSSTLTLIYLYSTGRFIFYGHAGMRGSSGAIYMMFRSLPIVFMLVSLLALCLYQLQIDMRLKIEFRRKDQLDTQSDILLPEAPPPSNREIQIKHTKIFWLGLLLIMILWTSILLLSYLYLGSM